MTRRAHPLMVLAGALLVALAIGVWLITQSGGANPVNQTRTVASFNAIELAGSNVVTVRVGGAQSVVVRARQSELDLITTQVQGSVLVIGNLPSRHGNKGPISVSVTVPSLRSLAIPGSGIVTLAGIKGPRFTVAVGGSGLVRASGTATRLDASIGGSGDLELDQLVARDVRAALTGSGQIVVTATQSLDASVAGNGVIRYGGNPTRLSRSVTGSGAVVPG